LDPTSCVVTSRVSLHIRKWRRTRRTSRSRSRTAGRRVGPTGMTRSCPFDERLRWRPQA
jgi:hypothetical protein